MKPNGSWTRLGEIEYPNTSTATHVAQTYLPIRAELANTGNTSNLIIKSGSVAAGITNGGGQEPSNRYFSYRSGPISISAGSNRLVAFRNKTTYNSITNYVGAILQLVSVGNETSKIAGYYILKNPSTTGGTWTDVSSDSCLEYSTDITVNDFTGESFFSWRMAKSDAFFENIEDLELNLKPGNMAVFCVNLPTGASGESGLSIRWGELF